MVIMALNEEVVGFIRTALFVEGQHSEAFVVFEQKQANARANDWNDEKDSFDPVDFKGLKVFDLTLAFQLQQPFIHSGHTGSDLAQRLVESLVVESIHILLLSDKRYLLVLH